MTIERLLAYFRKGHLREEEFYLAVSQLVAPQNVEAVLSELPAGELNGFRNWVSNLPDGRLTVFGSNLTREEAAKQEERLAIAIPAIRSWVNELQGRNGNDTRPATPLQSQPT